jgi:two-component system, OmpR family, response regulator MprA
MAATAGRTVPIVLIVDDDRKLVQLLERSLRYEGFDVHCAGTGAEGITLARNDLPDMVLLDIGLPDQDGFEVLRELRLSSAVPVVMLTARDDVSDKVDALGKGADDYVAKPFAFDELIARIRAVLRRRGTEALDRIAYEDLRCDLGSREVVRAGRRIVLTGKEFDLLAHLIRNARRVQTREALIRAVWGYDATVETNVVDVHVGHLRRKLGRPSLIQTVRGLGYVLRRAP